MKILCTSLLIYFYQLISTSGHPITVRQGSQELFVSEVIRVRRQAGYVYNKPSVSFDLPTRAPSLTVTTQAPTFDRTQAQMMYYAYPAPAAGGNAVNTGASAGATIEAGSGNTATASAGSSGGYNYGAQNGASASAQSGPTVGASQTGSAQSSSAGSSGYNYNTPSTDGGNGNAPTSSGAIQQPSNSGSSGYGYNAASAGDAQVSNSVESNPTSNAGFSQTGSVAGSGYEYNTPTSSQGPGVAPTNDVSTNAPAYLPPTSGSGGSNDVLSGSVQTGGDSVSRGSATVTQPSDQYLPPLPGRPDSPAAPVVDQYLPPNIQPSSPGPLPSSDFSVNKETQRGSGIIPSSNYIPPNPGQSPLTVTNVTPRPFSPASLSDAYLPPIANSQPSAANIPSTPASPYLPPVF